jgi:hypothetical protein
MNEHLKFENIKNKLKKIDNNLIVENYIPNNLIFYEEEEKISFLLKQWNLIIV